MLNEPDGYGGLGVLSPVPSAEFHSELYNSDCWLIGTNGKLTEAYPSSLLACFYMGTVRTTHMQ